MFGIQSKIAEHKRKQENIKYNEENDPLIEIDQKQKLAQSRSKYINTTVITEFFMCKKLSRLMDNRK